MGLESFIDYCFSLNLDLDRDIQPLAKKLLSSQEFEILAHRLKFSNYDFQTLDKLGRRFRYSKESIRRIEDNCIRKIIVKINWERDIESVSDILDLSINYLEIEKCAEGIGTKGVGIRMFHALRIRHMNTYRDIINLTKQYGDSIPRLYQNKEIRNPIYPRHIGVKSLVAFYRHLHSIGIELFEDGYTSEELGKN